MKIGSKHTSDQNGSPTLPKLQDPAHPGMILISRIGMFSLTLFTLLIATGVYMAATISLDIELSLSGVIKSGDQFVLYVETSKAMVLEPGQKAEVKLANGAMVNAEVSEVQRAPLRNEETVSITLKPTGEFSPVIRQFIRDNNGASVSATVFTYHSLWVFLKEKANY